ncbi:hypothetical protein BVG79_02137 [Ketogulonicigenium robustum]|uniref:Uncharacterized protein n=1 Tax=Ketogulonicigenium robustum TaxID=92947 RepID=A0A1W6P2F8_9RHOB|nr:hypothetical protein [Ketogulonicigenium robustum]ARO15477.1 hypothetical protein BVG79_02137 [Ketogulonicigenium robustum]
MMRPLAAQRLWWARHALRPLPPSGQLLPGPLRSPHLLADPAGDYAIQWSSPRNRLLMVDVTCRTPGAWLGLHIPFRALRRMGGMAFALDMAISPPALMRPVLRLPTAAGFTDIPFPRPFLGLPQGTHEGGCLFTPLARARWREWILFLPPDRSFSLVLSDLRLAPV